MKGRYSVMSRHKNKGNRVKKVEKVEKLVELVDVLGKDWKDKVTAATVGRLFGEGVKGRDMELVLSQKAHQKMTYLRALAETEISGFGLAPSGDPLYVEDVFLVRQVCSSVTTDMDDDGVAMYYDRMVKRGLQPYQFGRIWIHTHPGFSSSPSGTDEDTFERLFKGSSWGIMMIMGNDSYSCRMSIQVGPCTYSVEIPVVIERTLVDSQEAEDWKDELVQAVKRERAPEVGNIVGFGQHPQLYGGYGGYGGLDDYTDEDTTSGELRAMGYGEGVLEAASGLSTEEIGELLAEGFTAKDIAAYGSSLIGISVDQLAEMETEDLCQD